MKPDNGWKRTLLSAVMGALIMGSIGVIFHYGGNDAKITDHERAIIRLEQWKASLPAEFVLRQEHTDLIKSIDTQHEESMQRFDKLEVQLDDLKILMLHAYGLAATGRRDARGYDRSSDPSNTDTGSLLRPRP